MKDLLFTALSRDELQGIIADTVNACLRHHAAQRPPQKDLPPGEAGQLISKKEAARLISCSPGSIDNFARSGKIARHYVGKKSVRFDRGEVLALAKRTATVTT